MIEAIRTYNGYTRPEGRVKQTFGVMYRCKECGHITETRKEINQHECRKGKHVPNAKG